MHEVFERRDASNQRVRRSPERSQGLWIAGAIALLIVLGAGWYGLGHNGIGFGRAVPPITAPTTQATPVAPSATPKM
jgi:hypothetical protein